MSEGWGQEQFEQWFVDEVESSDVWQQCMNLLNNDGNNGQEMVSRLRQLSDEEIDGSVADAIRAIADQAESMIEGIAPAAPTKPDPDNPGEVVVDQDGQNLGQYPSGRFGPEFAPHFSRLSEPLRRAFFEEWPRIKAGAEARASTRARRPRWLKPGATIGAIVIVGLIVWSLSGDGDGDGDGGGDGDGDDGGGSAETADPAGPEEPLTADDAWETQDPLGDWEPFDTFEEIIRDRERDGLTGGAALDATDITGMAVSTEGDTTNIDVTHAGDAQGIEANRWADYRGGVTITLADGTRLEILFYDDGRVKVSNPPPGVTVQRFWLDPARIRFALSGAAVDRQSLVEATIYLALFEGVNLDTVSVGPG